MKLEELFSYAEQTYGVEPDYPWMDTPDACVLRHKENKKWFGLVMCVEENRLGKPGDRKVQVLNVKADPVFINFSVGNNGFYRAYHMNKEHWVTIHLEEASDDAIRMALDQSFALTEK